MPMVVEVNDDRTQDTHKVKLVKPMPAALPGIVFDALNSLRAALDQAGYDVAVAAGTTGHNAHFPFRRNLSDVQYRKKARSKDFPEEIFDLMLTFQPYKGGNDLLWALNKLCNSYKHELILPIGMHSGNAVKIDRAVFHGGFRMLPFPLWDRAKNEMVFAITQHGATSFVLSHLPL